MIGQENFKTVRKTVGRVRKFMKHFDLNLFTSQAKQFHASEVAAVLEGLDDEPMFTAFRRLEPSKKVLVFEYLELPNQQKLLTGVEDKETGFILNAMSPDDRTLLLSSLPGLQVTHLLNLLNP